MSQPTDNRPDRAALVLRLVEERLRGRTLRESAAAAGLHVATVCRWQRLCPELGLALCLAADAARRARRATRVPRPWVRWHPSCPACGAAALVLAVGGLVRFWVCSRRPACGWQSWRPRHLRDCAACGGPRYWSHSRRSVSCPACGTREAADPAELRPLPPERDPRVPYRVPSAAELLDRAAAATAPAPPRCHATKSARQEAPDKPDA